MWTEQQASLSTVIMSYLSQNNNVLKAFMGDKRDVWTFFKLLVKITIIIQREGFRLKEVAFFLIMREKPYITSESASSHFHHDQQNSPLQSRHRVM